MVPLAGDFSELGSVEYMRQRGKSEAERERGEGLATGCHCEIKQQWPLCIHVYLSPGRTLSFMERKTPTDLVSSALDISLFKAEGQMRSWEH